MGLGIWMHSDVIYNIRAQPYDPFLFPFLYLENV